jgi:hypothetical protein
MVQYLMRLDDLCPTNDLQKWNRFFDLFDRYGIKPIIAVIPDNKDPKLNDCGSFNVHYWKLVRSLQKKAYIIALHGFEHRYVNRDSGLLKLNNRSEFAGLSLQIQEKKIKAAVDIFKREKIQTSVFIAPAHTFDRNTLMALNKHSAIDIISDGLLKSPYIRFGFKWIPVQLSEVEAKLSGTWTFNYHPETCPDEAFEKVEKFIDQYHSHFVSLAELKYSPYTLSSYLSEKYQVYQRVSRNFIKEQMARFRKF